MHPSLWSVWRAWKTTSGKSSSNSVTFWRSRSSCLTVSGKVITSLFSVEKHRGESHRMFPCLRRKSIYRVSHVFPRSRPRRCLRIRCPPPAGLAFRRTVFLILQINEGNFIFVAWVSVRAQSYREARQVGSSTDGNINLFPVNRSPIIWVRIH